MSQAEVTRDEFTRLEARVSTIEQETEGEKMLSRYILTQARQNGDDLAVLKTRVDRIEEKVDRLEQTVGHIDLSLGAPRRDLPSIVVDAMRDVLRHTKSA
jgi:tetrahydromethanopterin S-methyltransferase subunit G